MAKLSRTSLPQQNMQKMRANGPYPGPLATVGRCRKGGPLQAAEKPLRAVILSGAKDLALSIFKAVRDSSSPAAPQNDSMDGFFRSLYSPALPDSW